MSKCIISQADGFAASAQSNEPQASARLDESEFAHDKITRRYLMDLAEAVEQDKTPLDSCYTAEIPSLIRGLAYQRKAQSSHQPSASPRLSAEEIRLSAEALARLEVVRCESALKAAQVYLHSFLDTSAYCATPSTDPARELVEALKRIRDDASGNRGTDIEIASAALAKYANTQ